LYDFARYSLPSLLIPPSGLIFWILLGLLVRRYRRRLGTAIISVSFALLYALAMPITGGLLTKGIEAQYTSPSGHIVPGAIIVLAGDTSRTTIAGAVAEPGPLSLQRLFDAAALAHKTHLPILVTGGRLSPNQPPSADILADVLTQAYDLPVTWRETDALNTCQNARLAAAMLRASGISAAYVVTQSWHLPRAMLAFERAGFPVIPSRFAGDPATPDGINDFLPRTTAWSHSYYAIHEWLGLIAYRLGACPPVPAFAGSTAAPLATPEAQNSAQ
jgi:uncharacterized SAM-binding protein YcdF (DUF218 family)